MTNSSDLVAVMAELHAALAPDDLAQTLRRVTEAAVELLPGVDGATITVEHADGRHETAAASGSTETGPQPQVGGPADLLLAAETAARLDHLQRVLDEGPAVDITEHSGPASEPIEPGQAPSVATSDLPRDERYPEYGAAAARAGVRAQVAVLLFDMARARGVLNLYSLQPGAFDDTAVLTDLFAHHSATALAFAAEYSGREITTPERQAVGQALGIVMERYRLPEAKAFALLHRTAEARAVTVRLVAQELVAGADETNSRP